MAKIVFKIQGSLPEPYIVEISPDPLTLSCTCMAGRMGIPCKHRIQIVKGYCDGIVEAPENYQEIISAIREALAGTDFKKILDKYTDRKNTEKAVNANSERLFKKYRDAIIAKALGKGTDKATQKALEDLNGAIQECVDVSAETEGLIMSLRGIFVRPEGPDSTTMAKEALGEE